jgi:medium-chain acyl-[acyl-carrier-protein] hydrolase
MSCNVQPEWHTEHKIASYEVDPQLSVRFPVLCRLMQEAAYHHAEQLGLGHPSLSSMNMAWVLARQRIKIHEFPAWGDTIQLRTWPSGRDRLFFYRDFEFTSDKGDRLLSASTAWFVIDTEKRERVPSDVYLTGDLPVGAKVFDEKLGRLKGCDGCGQESLSVNYGDLDMNGHVNNVRYIEWVLNSLALDFHETHQLQEFEVNFLAEALYGHEVAIATEKVDANHLSHSIVANGDELFRAKSVWHQK